MNKNIVVFKKALSFVLVLLMLFALAVPTIAIADAPDFDMDGYVSLPYKTENMKRLRTTVTSGSSEALSTTNTAKSLVVTDRYPVYGDSALIGTHNSSDVSEDFVGEDFIASTNMQIEGEAVEGSGSSAKNDRALISAEGTGLNAVAYGFVPLELLDNTGIKGIYYTWKEKSAGVVSNSKLILQWADENGKALANIKAIDYNENETDAYSLHTFKITKEGNGTFDRLSLETVSFSGASLDYTQLEDTIEAKVKGIRIILATVGTKHYKEFVVGTLSNNMAASTFADNKAVKGTDNNAVTVNFAGAITNVTERAKVILKNGSNEEVSTNAVWSNDGMSVTLTLAEGNFGNTKGYRVTTSGVVTDAGNTILNDVRFQTLPAFSTSTSFTASQLPNKVKLFDEYYNELDADTIISDNNIEVMVIPEEGQTIPNTIIPYFCYDNGTTVSNIRDEIIYNCEDGMLTNTVRTAYILANGITAIPVKNFNISIGGGSNASGRRIYNISIIEANRPANNEYIVGEIQAQEGEALTDIGLESAVTLSFECPLDSTDSIEITTPGAVGPEVFTAFAKELSEDKKSVTLTPTTYWTPGKTFTVTIADNASVWGSTYPIKNSDGTALSLTFTSDSETSAEIKFQEGEDAQEVGIISSVDIEFEYPIDSLSTLVITETLPGEAPAIYDVSNYEATLSGDGKTITLSPVSVWSLGAEYTVTIGEDASIFGDDCQIETDEFIFTASSTEPDDAQILAVSAKIGTDTVTVLYNKDEKVIYIPVTEEAVVDAVEFKFVLGTVAEYVEYNGTDYLYDEVAEAVVVAGVDLSLASGIDNAITISAVNPLGIEVEYKICTIDAAEPDSTVITLMEDDFENMDVNARPGDPSLADNKKAKLILAAGFQDQSASDTANAPTSNTDNQYVKIEQDPENNLNKVMHLHSEGGNYKYAAWYTTPLKKSLFKNADSITLSYKAFTNGSAGKFSNGRFGLYNASATPSYSAKGWLNKFQQHDSGSFFAIIQDYAFYEQYFGSLSRFLKGKTNAWYTYEITYSKSNVADRNTNINIKILNAVGELVENESLDIAWDFALDDSAKTNDDYLMWYLVADATDGATDVLYDDFKVITTTTFMDPELTLSAGTLAKISGEVLSVKFPSALEVGEEENLVFLDENGDTVDVDYSWSLAEDGKPVLAVTPKADLEYEQEYTVSGEFTDILGNNITLEETTFETVDEDYIDYTNIASTGIPEALTKNDIHEVIITADIGDVEDCIVDPFLYQVTSSDASVIKVTRTMEGYKIKAVEEGWAKIDIASDAYNEIVESEIVYVDKSSETFDKPDVVKNVAAKKLAAGEGILLPGTSTLTGIYGNKLTIIYSSANESTGKVIFHAGEAVEVPVELKDTSSLTGGYGAVTVTIPNAIAKLGTVGAEIVAGAAEVAISGVINEASEDEVATSSSAEYEITETLSLDYEGDIYLTNANSAKISTDKFTVKSSNQDVLKVTKENNKYVVKAVKPGWTYFTLSSEAYPEYNIAQYVFVSRTPLNGSQYTINGENIEISSTPVANDYGQGYVISYSAEANGTQDVIFTYGGGAPITVTVDIAKTTGDNKKTFFVKVPEAIVTNGGAYTLTTAYVEEGNFVYFQQGIVLEDANKATEDNCAEISEGIAGAIGRADDYDDLLDSEKKKLDESLAEKVADEPFADEVELREWYEGALDDAVEASDKKKEDSKQTPGGDVPSKSDPIVYEPSTGIVNTSVFTDLDAVTWAANSINTIAREGIASGIGDGKFAPLNLVKKEEFTKFVVVATGTYNPFLKAGFGDVKAGEWSDSYIASAVQANLILGIDGNTFGLGQNISRENMAVIIYRAILRSGKILPKLKTVSFSDFDNVSEYAKPAVMALAEAGILNGDGGKVNPKDTGNRAMAAQLIALALPYLR